jgi:hypothetical protein
MRSSGPVRAPVREVKGTTDGTRVRGRRLACAALVALSSLSVPARAERPSLRFLDSGPFLVRGQIVTVAWDGLPADVDELELLLSVDGGERFPIRLTRSIDPAPGSVAWTVPSVATNGARLRLRFGREGHEEDGEPSAPFRIFVPPGTPSSGFERREGECWVAGDAAPVPAGLRPVEGAFSAGEAESPAADLPDDDTPEPVSSLLPAEDFVRGARAVPHGASRTPIAAGASTPKRE